MSKNKKDDGLSNTFWIITISLLSIMVVLIIIGFVVFHNREPIVIEQEEQGGYVTLNYSSDVNALTIKNAKPTTDAVGMKSMNEGEYFDFSVDVNVDKASKVEYEISVKKDTDLSTISNDDIRVYLEKEESGTYTKVFGPEKYTPAKNYSKVGSEIGTMTLINVKKIKNETDNYRLRVWLSDKALTTGGKFSLEIEIHAIAK